MNKTQELQVEKIFRILHQKEVLNSKIDSLQKELENLDKKADKIVTFLNKQGVSTEEINSELDTLSNGSVQEETFEPEVQGFSS